MLVFGTAQSQGMAGQLGQSRQGRGTAEFQNHHKNAFSRPGSSKCWFWNCSKPGHGRAARAEQAGQFQNHQTNAFSRPGKLQMLVLERAEQAGQGHSRVPKPPKNAFSRPGELKMLVLELLKA